MSDIGYVTTLKDELWLAKQKIAGRCVNAIFSDCEKLILHKDNVNVLDFERIADLQFNAFGCTPTFLNYHGFPSKFCVSINKEIVHGTVRDYFLKEGDLVTIDVGATNDSAIADAARTWIYKKPLDKSHEDMVNLCRLALKNAISSIKVGNRLGCIGNAISDTVAGSNFGLVTMYGGHSVGINKPHEDPFISNLDDKNKGVLLRNGMSLAIEPILTLTKDTSTKVLSDGWTVQANTLGCHFEDTVTIMNDKVHLITWS